MSNHQSLIRLCVGNSTPEFRKHPGDTTSDDRAGNDIFRDEPTHGGIVGSCGPLGRYPRGAVDTRPLRTQKAVKRKA